MRNDFFKVAYKIRSRTGPEVFTLAAVVIFHLSCNKSHSVGINFVINGLKLFNYLLEVDKKSESFKWVKGGI